MASEHPAFLRAGNPWDAFADDQLGRMDHLGVPEFFYMGYCIGGFALPPSSGRQLSDAQF
jgi:hypothetical protein